jgi:hypothetical protein
MNLEQALKVIKSSCEICISSGKITTLEDANAIIMAFQTIAQELETKKISEKNNIKDDTK